MFVENRNLHVLVQEIQDRIFRMIADKLADFAATFEKQHRRNTADAVFARCAGIFIDIHLHDLHLCAQLLSHFFQFRSQSTTRSAQLLSLIHI